LNNADAVGRKFEKLIEHLLADPIFYVQVQEFFFIYLLATRKHYLVVSEEQRLSINDFVNDYVNQKL